MSLLFAHGSFTWTAADAVNTTYTISGLSFQPKAIRFYWVGINSATDASSEALSLHRGCGFATSTTNRVVVCSTSSDGNATSNCGDACSDVCAVLCVNNAGGIVGRLDINAINSDGFQMIVDTATSPQNIRIFYEVWGGSDITVASVGIVSATTTGDVDYTVTGFVGGAADQVVMFAGSRAYGTFDTGKGADSSLMLGFADGTNQVVVVGNADDNNATMNTDGYCQTGECLALIADGGGNPTTRASLTQFGTNNFRLNWAAVAGAYEFPYLAIKGGSWAAGAYTIDGSTGSATATVSGLPFAPVGVSLVGRMTVQDTAATSTANDRLGIGSASSTSSRRSMGCLDEDATANAEIDLTINYAAALCFPSTSGTLQSAYDINAFNSDGFQIIVDTAGGVASEWQGYLAFGNGVAAPEATIAFTTEDAVVAAAAEISNAATVAFTTEDATVAVAANVPNIADIAFTTDDSVVAAAGVVDGAASVAFTTDDATVAVVGDTGAPTVTVAFTTDNASVAATAEISNAATVAFTTDSAVVAATGSTTTAPPTELFSVTVENATTGAKLTGLTTVYISAQRDADGYRFDFTDNQFRAASAVPRLAMDEFSAANAPGYYTQTLQVITWDGDITITIEYDDGTRIRYWVASSVEYLNGVRIKTGSRATPADIPTAAANSAAVLSEMDANSTRLAAIDLATDTLEASMAALPGAIAAAIDAAIMSDGLTYAQAKLVNNAILHGKVTGAGTATESFWSVNQASALVERARITVDASGNRTAVQFINVDP